MARVVWKQLGPGDLAAFREFLGGRRAGSPPYGLLW
jgi:hypothetical protein